MDDRLPKIAERCLHGAENNSMTFPQIVGALMQAGFESYAIDFRRASATYYLPDGDSVALPTTCRPETSPPSSIRRPSKRRSRKRSNSFPDTLIPAFAGR